MQMETKLADKKANLSKILSMIDEAAKQNVKLAVFPGVRAYRLQLRPRVLATERADTGSDDGSHR